MLNLCSRAPGGVGGILEDYKRNYRGAVWMMEGIRRDVGGHGRILVNEREHVDRSADRWY